MKIPLFRISGLALGAALICLGVYWGRDPDAGSFMLMLGGLGIVVAQ